MQALGFLVLCLVGCVFSQNVVWKSCNKPGDHVVIKSLKFQPDPPFAGLNETISGVATVDETVSAGSVWVQLNYGPVLLVNNTYNLCQLLVSIGKSCPMKRGIINFSVTEGIPAAAPEGSYSGTIIATDQNGNELFCLSLSFTMQGSSRRDLPRTGARNLN